jgi:hypothetical protein
MKKALILVIAALMVPSVALAATSAPSSKSGKSAPKLTYVLKGTLSGFSAYNSSTSTDGSITIVVSKANYRGKVLKGKTLTFPLDANSKIYVKLGLTAITNGDKGFVRVRAAKKISGATLAATLQAIPASQVVDG